MHKGLSIALIAVGIALLILGYRASESLSSDVSKFFTDSPSDKAIWMLIGGGAALLIGLFGLGRGGTRSN
ncbi:MAG: DUF3185 family protein [Planctomycetota bacterium]|nr:MAG: DUF3185 family protein [Planctomycetota bacterium]